MSRLAAPSRAPAWRSARRAARNPRGSRDSGQREALPHALRPMLATLGSMPPDAQAWRFEEKWDGYRALVQWDGERCRILSRNGLDLTARFPELSGICAHHREPLLLDGEIVAVDGLSRASFAALQARMSAGGSPGGGPSWASGGYRVSCMLFDLLHRGGRSTRTMSLLKRRALLAGLELEGEHWSTPPYHHDGAALLERMRRRGAEGIIAKRAESRYLPGARTRDWLKVKLQRSDDFVVVGWWSSGADAQVSSLLLGYHDSAPSRSAGQPLRYAGKIGTGFSAADRGMLGAALSRDELIVPPCAGDLPRGPGVHWCRPRLVAQVRFTEWTRDGRLRHPAFLGLREDSEPQAVIHTQEERS